MHLAHDHHTHDHGHSHGSAHHHHGAAGDRLLPVLILTAVYMVAEAVGGWYTGSLALLADAGHMLADVAALALALFAAWFSRRPATARKTFGYHRAEILAALTNGVTLVIAAILICREAYERLQAPPPVDSRTMLFIAAGGFAVNLLSAWLLHGGHQENMNVRGAWLHVMGDLLGSVGAIAAAVLMTIFGWYAADPIISFVIALLIVWSSWQIIRDSANVLLEGTPAHINLAAVEDTLRETEGVADVHDLHVWTITSGRDALSAHVVHTECAAAPELLRSLRDKLRERFRIDHLTIQLEAPDFAHGGAHPCAHGGNCFGGNAVNGDR